MLLDLYLYWYTLSRSFTASEDRAECGDASVLAEGDGLKGGSSSEVAEVNEDVEEKRTKMELEAEFVRDQMNQYEQVRRSVSQIAIILSYLQ